MNRTPTLLLLIALSTQHYKHKQTITILFTYTITFRHNKTRTILLRCPLPSVLCLHLWLMTQPPPRSLQSCTQQKNPKCSKQHQRQALFSKLLLTKPRLYLLQRKLTLTGPLSRLTLPSLTFKLQF